MRFPKHYTRLSKGFFPTNTKVWLVAFSRFGVALFATAATKQSSLRVTLPTTFFWWSVALSGVLDHFRTILAASYLFICQLSSLA